jgi:mannosyltransferase OCH1-like enzyme
MIPKIIHQTWKNSNLPVKFRTYQKTWINHHPQWEYRFYDDEACRLIVQKYFPSTLVLYDSCPYPVQRADIFRYLVVAASGGIYADIDMECYKNMEPLLAGRECVFGVETKLSPRKAVLSNHKHSERIANCIFAATKNHPIFYKIMEEVTLRLDISCNAPSEIIETTGPGMLTDVVQKYRKQYDLYILPQICWLPPTKPDYPNIFPFNLHMYAKHHFSGTWKNEKACESTRKKSFLTPMRETLFEIPELLYKLPPSPVWREDFYFWRKNASQKKSRV